MLLAVGLTKVHEQCMGLYSITSSVLASCGHSLQAWACSIMMITRRAPGPGGGSGWGFGGSLDVESN